MGIVERMNRTLTQIARSMLIQSGCPKEFWAEALNTAAYIVNRMPDEDGKSPFYKVFGRHPRIKHMRMFGCRAFVQLERHERSKLDPKARAGIFVGYDASNWRCYRVWDSATRRVRLSVHVSFIEHLFPMLEQAGLHPGGDQEHGYVETSSGDLTRAIEMHPAEGAEEHVEEVPAVVETKEDAAEPMLLLPRHLNLLNLDNQDMMPEADTEHALYVTEENAFAVADGFMDDPKTYEEGMRSPYAKEWQEAMVKEMNALLGTKTWRLEELPIGAHVIGGKWVFRTKRNADGEIIGFKARWVAKGFSQKPGVDFDETWAPVPRVSSMRTVLSLAATQNWELFNMDVNSAFLKPYLAEEIYVVQPQGFERTGAKGEKLVCRMLKCLYGLKQAPRYWNSVIDGWMVCYGFTISEADPCVYIHREGTTVLIVLLWVDDLIIAGNNLTEISKFKAAISKRFEMKDLGELTWILGMEVRKQGIGLKECWRLLRRPISIRC